MDYCARTPLLVPGDPDVERFLIIYFILFFCTEFIRTEFFHTIFFNTEFFRTELILLCKKISARNKKEL